MKKTLLLSTVLGSLFLSPNILANTHKNEIFNSDNQITISTKEEIEEKITHIESEKDVVIVTQKEIDEKLRIEKLNILKTNIKKSINDLKDLTDEQRKTYEDIINKTEDEKYIKDILSSAKEQVQINKKNQETKSKEEEISIKEKDTSNKTSFTINEAKEAFDQLTEELNISEENKATWAEIIRRESGWNPQATNPSSGAYGLPQSLPGNKMASMGTDWKTNPYTQLKWMYNYMVKRYGSISGAMTWWNSHGWY